MQLDVIYKVFVEIVAVGLGPLDGQFFMERIKL
jgi:hypothetical protein